MPIGAAIGGAVIGVGGNIIAADKAGKAQTKAADKAADTSLQVAQLNAGLFREARDQNYALLKPWEQRGALGSYALTDLLLGTSFFPQAMANPQGGPAPAPAPSTGGQPAGGALNGFAAGQPASGLQPANAASIQQQAAEAIAAGADPNAVRARAAGMGITI